MEIALLAATTVDWLQLSNGFKNLPGMNPVDSVDKAFQDMKMVPGGLERFLNVVSALTRKKQIDDSSLNHAFFSFISTFEKDILLGLLFKKCSLIFAHRTAKNPEFYTSVISGTLLQWKEFICAFSQRDVSPLTREFANTFLMHFELMGLGVLWQNYRKVKIDDSTFVLEAIS